MKIKIGRRKMITVFHKRNRSNDGHKDQRNCSLGHPSIWSKAESGVYLLSRFYRFRLLARGGKQGMMEDDGNHLLVPEERVPGSWEFVRWPALIGKLL